MVALARANAKSLFSKFGFIAISKNQLNTNERSKNEKLSIKKEKSSNYFLEALKRGGVWLS